MYCILQYSYKLLRRFPEYPTKHSLSGSFLNMQEEQSIKPIVNIRNKQKHKLTMAKLYDNMVSTSYTLHTGELDKEKIEQQSYSFTKK